MHRFSRYAGALALSLLVIPASGCHAQARVAGTPGQVTMRFDYSGAEAILNALERNELSDAAVDTLLQLASVRAMIADVTRYYPNLGPTEFRQEIQAFVRGRQPGPNGRYFQLHRAWEGRAQVRTLVSELRRNEAGLLSTTLAQLGRYQPDSGPLAMTVYFVAGGTSDGFYDATPPAPALYANLVRARGDINGAVANLAHEAYHIQQRAAQRRAGLGSVADSMEALPGLERLLAKTLAEGTANYAVDPTRSGATGTNMDQSRERYRRNAAAERIAENFALFDSALAGLRGGQMTWDEAYRMGFTGDSDARFYFVGYEMAKAIDRYCGAACVRALFSKPPADFFRQYIGLYRRHPEITARFSRATEGFFTE